MEERQNASDWREIDAWLAAMKDESEDRYEGEISYLRHACFRSNAYPDFTKALKMIDSGAFQNTDEAKEWLNNKWKRLEPKRKDNEIALAGTDKELIELAKRAVPDLLRDSHEHAKMLAALKDEDNS